MQSARFYCDKNILKTQPNVFHFLLVAAMSGNHQLQITKLVLQRLLKAFMFTCMDDQPVYIGEIPTYMQTHISVSLDNQLDIFVEVHKDNMLAPGLCLLSNPT
jgi:hypothetical protein